MDTTLFVGLGKMGAPMARNYVQNRGAIVFDSLPGVADRIAEETTAVAVSSLEQIPDHIDTVLLMLPTSAIVEDVLLGGPGPGLLAQLPLGALVIDMGSSEPESTRRMAERARSREIDYVDAPVSGGVAKATEGNLSIMVGGDDSAVQRAMVHLEPLGDQIVHVGGVGSGHAAKALNNLLSATNLAAAAEALSAATRIGIRPEKMLEVINNSTGRSQASEVKYPQHILTGTFRSGFSLALMVKDIGIASRLIHAEGVSAEILQTGANTAQRAQEAFPEPAADHTELARLIEEENDVRLRYHDG